MSKLIYKWDVKRMVKSLNLGDDCSEKGLVNRIYGYFRELFLYGIDLREPEKSVEAMEWVRKIENKNPNHRSYKDTISSLMSGYYENYEEPKQAGLFDAFITNPEILPGDLLLAVENNKTNLENLKKYITTSERKLEEAEITIRQQRETIAELQDRLENGEGNLTEEEKRILQTFRAYNSEPIEVIE